MKKPKIEQLINEGIIEGINFEQPLDFSQDSWGKYDSERDNWGTEDPETHKWPLVATFGQVRVWIQNTFRNILESIHITKNNGEIVPLKTVVTELNTQINGENGLNTTVINISNTANQLSQKFENVDNPFTIIMNENGSDIPYIQLHNVFRITRQGNGSFKIKQSSIPTGYNLELRLGPFDELLEIGSDVQINDGYIDLISEVDPGEEIIIKLIKNN